MRSPPDPSPPFACTLSPDRFRDRKALVAAILKRGLVQLVPLPDGVRARFVAGGEIDADLRALVKLEAECCSSLSMTVHGTGSDVILEVTGPPDTHSLIADLFTGVADTGRLGHC